MKLSDFALNSSLEGSEAMNTKIGEAALGVTRESQPCNPLTLEDTTPMKQQTNGEVEQLVSDAALREMATHDLATYIKWANQRFKHIRIYSTGGADGVPGLQIRFDALQQDQFRPLGWWINLQQNIEERSGDTVFTVSDGSLFVKGILDLGISSQNYGYRDSLVIDMLNWLFDEMIAD